MMASDNVLAHTRWLHHDVWHSHAVCRLQRAANTGYSWPYDNVVAYAPNCERKLSGAGRLLLLTGKDERTTMSVFVIYLLHYTGAYKRCKRYDSSPLTQLANLVLERFGG